MIPPLRLPKIVWNFSKNCVIVPHETLENWNDVAESYLHVTYIGEKFDETPHEYIYDIDNEN